MPSSAAGCPQRWPVRTSPGATYRERDVMPVAERWRRSGRPLRRASERRRRYAVNLTEDSACALPRGSTRAVPERSDRPYGRGCERSLSFGHRRRRAAPTGRSDVAWVVGMADRRRAPTTGSVLRNSAGRWAQPSRRQSDVMQILVSSRRINSLSPRRERAGSDG
jgi:hypothetical protein